MTNFLTFAQVKALKVGERVAFPDGAEAYPDFLFRDRLTEIVSEVDHECVWVKIDQHKDELNDWNNQIQIWLWSEDELAHNVERLLSPDDGSLDRFVLAYCDLFHITCDGDVFGVMFTGQTVWTETEAIAVIEEASRLYGLRR